MFRNDFAPLLYKVCSERDKRDKKQLIPNAPVFMLLLHAVLQYTRKCRHSPQKFPAWGNATLNVGCERKFILQITIVALDPQVLRLSPITKK